MTGRDDIEDIKNGKNEENAQTWNELKRQYDIMMGAQPRDIQLRACQTHM